MAFTELDFEDVLELAEISHQVNRLSYLCRKANDRWWHEPLTGAKLNCNAGEKFMLMVSEIAEAMEGNRKSLMDDKLPNRLMEEVELADAIIRIMDYAGEKKFDIGGAIYEKIKFNSTRKDHSIEARLSPEGKKY